MASKKRAAGEIFGDFKVYLARRRLKNFKFRYIIEEKPVAGENFDVLLLYMKNFVCGENPWGISPLPPSGYATGCTLYEIY